MDESVLGDFIEDDGQKLLYVFDYMTERAFFIEMTKMQPGRSLKDPVCTLSLGAALLNLSTLTSSMPKSTPRQQPPTSTKTSTVPKASTKTSSKVRASTK